ncbi:MAG: diacylglycerol kinase family protein, partial [Sphaerochaetaceae bacterium]
MNVAVVFNEHSHLSVEHLAALGRRIQKLFTGASFVTCRGFGHTYIEDSSVLEVGRVLDYKQRITMMVQTLLQKKPDYVVSVGGDGLASYIASTIAKKAEHVVMLGIAAGTANVGPIVSFSLDELNSLTFADLEVVSIDGIEVVDETGYLGLGFNDVILGNSFLGTEHGTCCNLSVESLLIHGERVPVKVGKRITTERFMVVIDGHPKQLFSQLPIAQIVVTPLQFDKLYGRAIFGGLCLGHDI